VNFSKNLVMTAQRQVILDELRKTTAHPSADEVYRMVRERLPRISLGTVYRNLEILAASGLIQKLETAGTQKRFDAVTADHYHMRCVRCGRVEDAPIQAIAGLDDALDSLRQHEIVGHRLEFLVVCPICREKGISLKSREK
jgi:Fur family ferric uptake transcriptional regulator